MSPETTESACPNCAGHSSYLFHRIRDVPVNSCLLFDDRAAARAFPRGDIALSYCAKCHFIYNAAWAPDRTVYSDQYEETQVFSGTFSQYQKRQVEQLLTRYGLFEKEIVEIGCGKGEFLSLLCELGRNHGVGYDPSFVPARQPDGGMEIVFRREFFGPETAQSPPDLVCCKMTLEHISDTKAFAEGMRRIVSAERGTVIFIQVPDVRRILAEGAFWDIYYEHCSYFSPSSLSHVLRSVGLEVLRIGAEFGDQYLTIEARAASPSAKPHTQHDGSGEEDGFAKSVSDFALTATKKAAQWGSLIRAVSLAGGKAVLWGSGSKAVSFLAATQTEPHVQYLVDINPHRWGKFVPGSGTKIVSPAFRAQYQPDLVIAMNAMYSTEIMDDLKRLDAAGQYFARSIAPVPKPPPGALLDISSS